MAEAGHGSWRIGCCSGVEWRSLSTVVCSDTFGLTREVASEGMPMAETTDAAEAGREVAYYYPEPYWRVGEVDSLKTLLLFFDEIAILLPRYMRGRETAADPVLAGPLHEQGLLRVLEPEVFVDQQMTEELSEVVVELITGGAFDDLETTGYYAELSRSRMGWDADVDLAGMVIEELEARNLARPSQDGVSVPPSSGRPYHGPRSALSACSHGRETAGPEPASHYQPEGTCGHARADAGPRSLALGRARRRAGPRDGFGQPGHRAA
jgi:hypothetical protein